MFLKNTELTVNYAMYIHNNVGEIKENVVGGYDSYLTRDQQFLRNILLSDTCYLCSLL